MNTGGANVLKSRRRPEYALGLCFHRPEAVRLRNVRCRNEGPNFEVPNGVVSHVSPILPARQPAPTNALPKLTAGRFGGDGLRVRAGRCLSGRSPSSAPTVRPLGSPSKLTPRGVYIGRRGSRAGRCASPSRAPAGERRPAAVAGGNCKAGSSYMNPVAPQNAPQYVWSREGGGGRSLSARARARGRAAGPYPTRKHYFLLF